jgi:hypothetical protein
VARRLVFGEAHVPDGAGSKFADDPIPAVHAQPDQSGVADLD